MKNSRENQRKVLLEEMENTIKNYGKLSRNKKERILSELEYEGRFHISRLIRNECYKETRLVENLNRGDKLTDIIYLKAVKEIIQDYKWIYNKERFKNFMKNITVEINLEKEIKSYSMSNDYIKLKEYTVILKGNQNKKLRFIDYINLSKGSVKNEQI